MNELIIKSVFFLMCFWAIGLILTWFRSNIDLFWKIAATLMLLFYCWFFFEGITKGIEHLRSDWYIFVLDFFKEFMTLVFVNLFFLWPLALFMIFFKSDDIGSEKLLRFMCILTVASWIIFLAYFYFGKHIGVFFYETLKQMIPFAK